MTQSVVVAPPAPPKERYIPNGLKFAFGGLAGMAATCVVQPLDLIKTRMQLSGGSKTSFTVAREIVAREGFFAVYAGLSAGLLRQATYTTTRLGVYNYLFDAYKESDYDSDYSVVEVRTDAGKKTKKSSPPLPKTKVPAKRKIAPATVPEALSPQPFSSTAATEAIRGIRQAKEDFPWRNNGAAPGFGTKTLLGVAAGSIGAFVGTPAEVALIRMTADGRLPKEQRRNYKNVGDALIRIIREEGVLKLWRGATPTVGRAMVVNAAQLSTYSQASQMFTGVVPAGITLHFCASMVSGLVTTIASMPVDIIKTRIQNAGKGTSQLAVVTSLLKNEGVLTLWKGFLPYYARLGPHTVLTFIFLEQMNTAYLKNTA